MRTVTSPRLGCIAVITATCLIHRGPGNQSIKWSSYQRTNETEPSELAAAGGILKTQPTCTQSSRPVASLRARPINYLHIVHHVFAQQNTFILKYDTCHPQKNTDIHAKVAARAPSSYLTKTDTKELWSLANHLRQLAMHQNKYQLWLAGEGAPINLLCIKRLRLIHPVEV